MNPSPYVLHRRLPKLLAAFCVPWLLLSLPGTLTSGDWRLMTLPVEALLLAGVLMALPLAARGWLVWPVALVAAVAGGLQILDQGFIYFLGRPLNPVLDAGLVPRLWELMQGALGLAITALVAALLVAGLAALLLALHWSVAVFANTRAPLAGMVVAVLAAVAWQAGGPVTAHTSPTVRAIAERGVEMIGERRAFEAELAQDGFVARLPEQPLARLEGHDVLVVFIESYGRQAIDQARYFDTVEPALEQLQDSVESRGFAMKSGWSEAPIIGGQSWLAHATLLSGLWIDNQIRYQVLAQAEPAMLSHVFAEAGWHNALVMPAITRAWPEKTFMGFEEHLFADDLGYTGKPYNWVTMPDQYTLYAFEERTRTPEAPPLFATLALISSHAPWTPIPPVIEDWSEIGDGAIFSQWADDGDPPEVLWLDPERVRQQYTLSIDYVLRTLAGYVEEMRERPFLMIALGDHEAGAIVAGADAPRDVPVHLIASERELLEPFADWEYRQGAFPDAEGRVPPMDRFRDFLVEQYSR